MPGILHTLWKKYDEWILNEYVMSIWGSYFILYICLWIGLSGIDTIALFPITLESLIPLSFPLISYSLLKIYNLTDVFTEKKEIVFIGFLTSISLLSRRLPNELTMPENSLLFSLVVYGLICSTLMLIYKSEKLISLFGLACIINIFAIFLTGFKMKQSYDGYLAAGGLVYVITAPNNISYYFIIFLFLFLFMISYYLYFEKKSI